MRKPVAQYASFLFLAIPVNGGTDVATERKSGLLIQLARELLNGIVDHVVRGVVQFRETGLESLKTRAGHVVRGNASVDGIDTLETRAGQTEVHAQLAVEARKEEAAANLGQKANLRLGHCKQRILRRNAERRVHTETDTTAHY